MCARARAVNGRAGLGLGPLALSQTPECLLKMATEQAFSSFGQEGLVLLRLQVLESARMRQGGGGKCFLMFGVHLQLPLDKEPSL